MLCSNCLIVANLVIVFVVHRAHLFFTSRNPAATKAHRYSVGKDSQKYSVYPYLASNRSI